MSTPLYNIWYLGIDGFLPDEQMVVPDPGGCGKDVAGGGAFHPPTQRISCNGLQMAED